MTYKRFIVPVTFVFLLCIGVTPLYAGWVQVNKDGQRSIISEGKMKSGSAEGWMVIDANTGIMTIVNTDSRSYMSNTPEGFCKQVNDMQEKMLSSVPPEQRAMVEQMMKGNNARSGKEAHHKVRLEKAGNGGSIAGYNTVKYNVLIDGETDKVIWYTSEAAPGREFGSMERVIKMGKEFAKCAMRGKAPYSPDDSPAFLKLLNGGWILKAAKGGRVLYETTSLKRETIDSGEFDIPSDYKLTTFSKMMRSSGGGRGAMPR